MRTSRLIYTSLLVFVGCAHRPAAEPHATPDWISIETATIGVGEALEACKAAVRATQGDPDKEGMGDYLAEQCISAIIPSRQALIFAAESTDGLSLTAHRDTQCAAETVYQRLVKLSAVFDQTGTTIPNKVLDTISYLGQSLRSDPASVNCH